MPAPRRSQLGLTLIEVMMAIAIATALFAAVVVGLGALTGSAAKAATGELAGVIRSLYDTASLTGKTCRLVFELPKARDEETPVKYWAECAAHNVTTSRDRGETIEEANRDRAERARDARSERSRTSDFQEVMDAEQQRVESEATFAAFTSETIAPRTFSTNVQVEVWTRHQEKPVSEGLAYLYFFPQGYTETAHVKVKQGENVWTILVSPLTGKAKVVARDVEPPRA